MRTVAMIIFPGVQALDVSGPLDVFAEANGFVADSDRYEISLVGPTKEPFRASNGMPLAADVLYEEADRHYDLALVAGGPNLPTGQPDARMIDCILRVANQSGEYGSVCTGAFALGHAGLLDGRNVTTHWQNAEALAIAFPKASVDRDSLFLRDGRMITSAGVTAGIDMALAIVAKDHGSKVAVAVAKRLVVLAQRLGGQSQFSPYLAVTLEDGSPLAKVSGYVMAHLNDRLAVADLADVAGMSSRNFARLFSQQTKVTPADFVEQARVDAARRLLEGGTLPLKAIAYECGFATPKRMRNAFLKTIGVSPIHYRETFRSSDEHF